MESSKPKATDHPKMDNFANIPKELVTLIFEQVILAEGEEGRTDWTGSDLFSFIAVSRKFRAVARAFLFATITFPAYPSIRQKYSIRLRQLAALDPTCLLLIRHLNILVSPITVEGGHGGRLEYRDLLQDMIPRLLNLQSSRSALVNLIVAETISDESSFTLGSQEISPSILLALDQFKRPMYIKGTKFHAEAFAETTDLESPIYLDIGELRLPVAPWDFGLLGKLNNIQSLDMDADLIHKSPCEKGAPSPFPDRRGGQRPLKALSLRPHRGYKYPGGTSRVVTNDACAQFRDSLPLECLEQLSITSRSCLAQLILTSSVRFTDLRCLEIDAYESKLRNPSMLSLARQFLQRVKVEELHLHNFGPWTPNSEVVANSGAKLRVLEYLNFEDLAYPNPEEISSMASSCPSIEQLTIDLPYLTPVEGHSAGEDAKPPNIIMVRPAFALFETELTAYV